MGLESRAGGSESRFAAYVEAIIAALGHADRAATFQSYCAGLLLPGDRKSVEPMGARIQPGRVQAAHQSLHHFVAKADWSDDAVLAAVRARVLPTIEQHGRWDGGEPDAIVPHVRFDEWRQETEPCQPGLRECAKATPTTHRATNITAPVVDSIIAMGYRDRPQCRA